MSLWKVDDTATALLMERLYQNVLGIREGLTKPMPKAEALEEAKKWLAGLSRSEVERRSAELVNGVSRGKRKELPLLNAVPKAEESGDKPYAHPYYWSAFILVGDGE